MVLRKTIDDDTTEPMPLDDSAASSSSSEDEDRPEANDDGDECMDADDDVDDESEAQDLPKEVYLPGRQLADDEELVVDDTAYVMLHQAQTGDPCLSFDVIEDRLGSNRIEFPLTMYLAAGTQSPRADKNKIIVMKISNLQKTQPSDSGEESSDEEEDADDEKLPDLETAFIKHPGCVNRIRCCMVQQQPLCATWSEQASVHIWQLSQALEAVDDIHVGSAYVRNGVDRNTRPLYSFSGHQQEGFALDWSATQPGVLASGDCASNIHVWQPGEAGLWSVDRRPLAAHTDSIEDLQWSPDERAVLASCSVDKSVRVWDVRAAGDSACMLHVAEAHHSDVNVLSWSRRQPFLVSGGDDGRLCVWDLRTLKSGVPVAVFKHHTAPVTSVQWHPHDSSVFASSGADDQLVQWDLSVEACHSEDTDSTTTAAAGGEGVDSLPPQLLFIHQGQKDIKELHWHPQLPGCLISTALSGFNVFRTISV